MSIPTGEQNGRQLNIVLFAVACLVALGILAVGVAGSSAFATTGGDNAPNPTEQVTQYSGIGLVGGGNVGGAESINISADETSPVTNESSEIQFIATAEAPQYWRVDAYNQYETNTWERTGEYRTYRGEIEPVGPVNNTAKYNISLKQPAAALPAPWQPASISATETRNLTVSSQGGFHAATPLSSGGNYTVSSYKTDPKPRELLIARRTYPEDIESEYTALPNNTAARIGTLSDEITTNAVTPVQAACAVDDWLKTNKSYTRSGVELPETSPVETFLFEREQGNARVMASSMAVLLRSQEIPTRYVTGYTPGEKRGTNRYAVRAVNAHAWTEIYVSGYGWVPFDPTPNDTRLAVENQVVESDGRMVDASLPADCSVAVDIEPLPDDQTDSVRPPNSTEEVRSQERISDDNRSVSVQTIEEVNTSSLTSANTTIQTEPDPLIIGGTATAEIQREGAPAANNSVFLAGQQLGRTDTQGRIEFTVPETLSGGEKLLIVRSDDVEEGAVVTLAEFRLNASQERLLALPDEPVQITATVGEEPIGGVELTRNGNVVATTDANGTAIIPLSVAPTTTISAQYNGQTTSIRIENRLLSVLLRIVGITVLAGVVSIILNRRFDLLGAAKQGAIRTSTEAQQTGRMVAQSVVQLPNKIAAVRRHGIRRSLSLISQWLVSMLERIRGRLPDSLLLYLISLGVQLYQMLRREGQTAEKSASEAASDDSTTPDPTTTDGHDGESPSSLQRIWTTFVRLVFRRVTPTYTPGEVARKAIDKGFPATPVNRLTNAFRTAAYSPTPADEVQTEASEALDQLQETAASTEQRAEPQQEANKNEK
jgi:transglutaminase-like putative cysteine protease